MDLIKYIQKKNKEERELKAKPSKWVVNVFGSHKGGEISIVRENNTHGRLSYGWPEKDQKIIVHAVHTLYDETGLDKEVWRFARSRACALCAERNK